MPGWLQTFTDVQPAVLLADAARGLMVGGPVAHGLWMTLAWSVGITAVMAPLAVAQVPHEDLSRRRSAGAAPSAQTRHTRAVASS